MGRYIGPKCRLCRREGSKLFLKGDRCHTSKCALTKRKYPPGVHGPKQSGRGAARLTEYGTQLRAKQSAKRIYGLLERKFYSYYIEAVRSKNDTGEQLLQLLETRFDNVIYRSGFVTSRSSARQIVCHGFFLVNDRMIDIPSYQVKIGDIIKFKETKNNKTFVKSIGEQKNKQETPSWLQVDLASKTIKVLSLPKRDDFVENIDDKLIIEFYCR